MQYADDNGMQLLVGFQMINTVTRELPAELASMAWDDVVLQEAGYPSSSLLNSSDMEAFADPVCSGC